MFIGASTRQADARLLWALQKLGNTESRQSDSKICPMTHRRKAEKRREVGYDRLDDRDCRRFSVPSGLKPLVCTSYTFQLMPGMSRRRKKSDSWRIMAEGSGPSSLNNQP